MALTLVLLAGVAALLAGSAFVLLVVASLLLLAALAFAGGLLADALGYSLAAVPGGVAAAALGVAVLLAALTLLVATVRLVVREFRGDGMVLASLDARRPDGAERTRLAPLVGRCAQQAGLPAPSVRVRPVDAPEALSVGYRPETTTLVVSTGLLDALDDRELEAVVAHELAHVKNRDAAVMTLASLPVAGARALADREAADEDAASLLVYLVGATTGVLGRALVASLSRAREVAADRGAVAITGDPSALASALGTLDSARSRRPARDGRHRSDVAAALSILPTDAGAAVDGDDLFAYERRWLARKVYHTHPPTDERLARLRALERANER